MLGMQDGENPGDFLTDFTNLPIRVLTVGQISRDLTSSITFNFCTPGIRPNASGAATVSPDGKQVGKNFITNLIIIIKVCYLLYFFRINLVCNLEAFNVFTFKSICTINEYKA